jgi:hypothetical protein
MAGPGVDPNDQAYLYTMSLYFVCTTLSTCGYGDFCATPGDRIEALVILILEFVGMLFYSYTIDRIQTFMINEEISSGEYAHSMTEIVENMVVKVSKLIPTKMNKIDGSEITDWKLYTVNYFKYSPNSFFEENEFFQDLPENLRKNIIEECSDCSPQLR